MRGRRNRELIGLSLVSALFFLGLSLLGMQSVDVAMVPVWILLITVVAAHVTLRLTAPSADPMLLPLAFFLSALGLLELAALGNRFAEQARWIAGGMIALIIVVAFVRRPERLGGFKYIFGLSGVGLLLSPILFGTVRGGSKLWLEIGGLTFQPAEPAKIFLTIFLAAYLAEKKEVLSAGRRIWLGLPWPQARHFGPLILTWLISLAILVLEKDLGSSLIFFSLFLTLLFMATGRVAYVAVGTALFLAGAVGAYKFFPHVAARIDVWMQPLPADISDSAYQVAQSLFALSAGGLTGVGLGEGLLGREIMMPAVHTDFIFAALGEELGLAGVVALTLAYLLILARGFRIARLSTNDFSRLLAAGLATVTIVQTIVIIGGVIKLLPLTGVTLPFVSYGGSSIVSSFLIIGLLATLSRTVDGTPA